MRKAILLVIMFALSGWTNELKTVYSYQNALSKAKKEQKLVLVMMSYSGCPLCDYMKDIVLERPRVLDYLNEHFFVVIKDLQKDRYPERFSVIDTPTFFFIDPVTQKEVIPRRSGGFRPDAFLGLLHEATGEPMPQEAAGNRVTENNATKHNTTTTLSAAHPATDLNATDTNRTLSSAENNSSLAPCHKNVPCAESRKITIN